jgi:methionyl-tRNA synthetase
MITIDQFAQVEMRVGLVTEATAIEGSGKLIRQVVNFGEDKRIVFSGIKKWYKPEDLVGKKFIYVTNLEPRKILNEESQAMILGVETGDGRYVLLEPAGEVEVGARLR